MFAEKRVLVVEDNPNLNRLYTKYLQQNGYEVASESSVSGTYQYLSQTLPDVIVMDLDLIDGSGQDILDMMIRDGRYNNVKVVVVSGTLYISQRNIKVDRADYALLKPVSPRELVSLVNTL